MEQTTRESFGLFLCVVHEKIVKMHSDLLYSFLCGIYERVPYSYIRTDYNYIV